MTLDERVPRGQVPRADVAAVLAALLHEPRTAGHVLELVGGTVPIQDAVDALTPELATAPAGGVVRTVIAPTRYWSPVVVGGQRR